MKEFDNFNLLKSIKEIQKGINPYDKSKPDSPDCKFNDLSNLDICPCTIRKGKFEISWYNYNMVLTIYNTYIRRYGEDFIREYTEKMKGRATKAWVLYALNKYPALVEDKNNDTIDELEELLDKLHITDQNVIETFKTHMPFLSEFDVFRFAYDNINSPKLEFFYLLLIWLYENDYPTKPHLREYQTCKSKDECKYATDCKIKNINKNTCLYDEKLYGKDYSFTQELTDFQKGVITKFLYYAPQEIKEKALIKLYESFKQINQTNIFENKLSLSYEKVLCNKDNPLTGNFYITWNKVEFYNGFYLISHPNVPSNIKQFYRIEDRHSRLAFNDIKKIFLERLPPIHVEAKNGKIIKIRNKANLCECTILMEHEVNANFEKKNKNEKVKVEKKILTKDEATIFCKDFKSQYLDKLCMQQIEKYKVICCIEHRINSSGVIHDEYSFIFTIKESKEKIYLVYENAANSRSTYILPITKNTWEESIDNIYNFFASNEINKRQQMASKLIDLKLPGNYEYKRIFHTDYSSWHYKIQDFFRGL